MTKVTISNQTNDNGRNVKLTVSTYGQDIVKIVTPGETLVEWVHQDRSLLIEDGDYQDAAG